MIRNSLIFYGLNGLNGFSTSLESILLKFIVFHWYFNDSLPPQARCKVLAGGALSNILKWGSTQMNGQVRSIRIHSGQSRSIRHHAQQSRSIRHHALQSRSMCHHAQRAGSIRQHSERSSLTSLHAEWSRSVNHHAQCTIVSVNTSPCSAVTVNTSSGSALKVNTSSCSAVNGRGQYVIMLRNQGQMIKFWAEGMTVQIQCFLFKNSIENEPILSRRYDCPESMLVWNTFQTIFSAIIPYEC